MPDQTSWRAESVMVQPMMRRSAPDFSSILRKRRAFRSAGVSFMEKPVSAYRSGSIFETMFGGSFDRHRWRGDSPHRKVVVGFGILLPNRVLRG